MRRGLVVGKFMPLHRGHQLLIETALANVDELTVVVYDVNVPGARNMPIRKRMKWITDLYPQLHTVVAGYDPLPDLPASEKDDPKYAHVYADHLEYLGPFTHVFSSEDYGDSFAEALGAESVVVDPARDMMPVSGTMLRENLYFYRAYVDPLVYRSLIQKVVFVGTESTGKSTISKSLATRLHTMHTSEYGRTLWEHRAANEQPTTFRDLWDVGRTQYEQEQAAVLHSDRFLFCDTNAWTTMLWSEMYYNSADARLIELAERTKDEYIWFLCGNDIEWEDDGSRELRDGKATEFQGTIIDRLHSDGIEYHSLIGDLDERMDTVVKWLTAYKLLPKAEAAIL